MAKQSASGPRTGRTTFVEQWLDPAYSYDAAWSPTGFAQLQYDRIMGNILVAQYAHSIPRRLGGDASAAELARDKKLNKRLRSRWISILRLWDGEPADVDEIMQLHEADAAARTAYTQRAAAHNWHIFMAEYIVEMRALLENAANNATKLGHNKVANQYCNRLLNELHQIHQVYVEIYGENPTNTP